MGILQQVFQFAVKPLPRKRRGECAADLTGKARRLLLAIGEWKLAGEVTVVWYARLRSTAGLAACREHTVYLNPKLQGLGPDEPDHTLKHELAHLVAYSRAGRRRIAPHGPEWLQACADLGIPGERPTHTLPLPRSRRARPYAYACAHCGGVIRRTKPFRCFAACYTCCRKYNDGRYDTRFRYTRVKE